LIEIINRQSHEFLISQPVTQSTQCDIGSAAWVCRSDSNV